MDRDVFLARVRRATATARLPDPPTPVEVQHESDDLIADFTTHLTRVDGIVHEPAARDDVAPLVVELLTGAGAQTFLAWDADHLPVPSVIAALGSAGLTRVEAEVPLEPLARREHQAAYDDVDAGVTGAHAGLAVSGSIVLTSGAGRPRMASLIPDIHVALLPRHAVTTTVSEWMAANPQAAGDTANLVFVTGPSRTGDIEMRLNLGVHGPRSIHVILVPDDD